MGDATTEVVAARPLPAGAIAISVFACGAFLAIDALPLPGLKAGVSPGAFHLASNGLETIVESFILVEVVAVLVPGLRPLRQSAEGRIRLRVTAYFLAAAFALIKVFRVLRHAADLLEQSSLLRPHAFDPRVAVAAALLGGALAPILLARLIDARGIGVGYSLLIATGLAAILARAAHHLITEGDGDVLLPLVLLAGFGFAAFAMLRSAAHREFRLPTSGIEPVHQAVVLAMLALGTGFAQSFFWPWVPPAIDRLWVTRALQLLLTVALCRLFSRLFHKPRTEEATLALRRATRASAAWLCALTAASWYVDHVYSSAAIGTVDALSLIAIVAVGMDLAHEFQAWLRRGDQRVLRVLDRLEDADALSAALHAQGIEPALRGAHHRSLFHFFAPFVPISVLIAEADVERGEVVAVEHERALAAPPPMPS